MKAAQIACVLMTLFMATTSRAVTLPGIYKINASAGYCNLGTSGTIIQISTTANWMGIYVYSDGTYPGVPKGFNQKLGWMVGDIVTPPLAPGYQTEKDTGAFSADGSSFTYSRYLDGGLFDTQTVAAGDSGALYTHSYAGGAMTLCPLTPTADPSNP